jgi:hypothetical protein
MKIRSFVAAAKIGFALLLVQGLAAVEAAEVKVIAGVGIQGSLAGLWYHDRKGGNFSPHLKGSIELKRTPACDQGGPVLAHLGEDGYTCFTGTPKLADSSAEAQRAAAPPDMRDWQFAVRGTEVVVCLGNYGAQVCRGTLDEQKGIAADCMFFGQHLGVFTASRSKQ